MTTPAARPDASTTYAATLADVREAAARIAGHAHRTPILTCATIDRMAGRSLHFKCEMFQKGGAFKFRGALNAVLQLDDAVAAQGVATHSSGNHAQALALAARMRGVAAHIVMPRTAPRVKREAVEAAGAHVYESEPTQVAREAALAEVTDRTGATYIPSYNHPHIIAGQGTMAMELLEDVSDLDAIVAPIGGGGMIGGIAIAATALKPGIRVIAAEPTGADDAARSKQAGELVTEQTPKTVADGLLMAMGDQTWPIVRDLVEAVITVTDEQIMDAMKLIWQRMKVIVEPSGATSLAAVLSPAFQELTGLDRVGVVFSGGNVDLDRLPWLPR